MRFRFTCCCIAVAALLAGPAFAQWTQDYSTGTGETYTAVMFPSATVGYMVGSGGIIYKTIDGGDTWVSQISPTVNSFFDVFFKSETEGWAVGDLGVIAYTTDGTNWNLHSQSGALTVNDINQIYFYGTSGWMVADGALVYLSTDNGVTWGPATTIPYTDDFNSVVFTSALNGMVCADGDGMMYSTDGGVTWNAATVNLGTAPYTRTDIERVVAVNDTVAIATGWGSSAAGLQPTIIILTDDGGLTWNVADPTYAFETYAYGYGIGLFSNGDAVIVGGGSGSAAPVLRSSPGYGTWTRSPAFFGGSFNGCTVVPGTDRIIAVGDGSCIATSDDRGVSWSYYYDVDFGFQGIMAFEAYGDKLYAVGTNGLFMVRDNAGDWTVSIIAPDYWAPVMEAISVVPYADPLDGYVIYAAGRNDYLCKSTDGGATWTELRHAISNFDAIYGMHWFDPLNGLLVGKYNREDVIYATDDGGLTFTQIWYNVKSEQFNSISFAPDNPLIGVIVADNIAMYYTTDGGTSWTAGTENIVSTTADLEEVCMVDATTGWCVGDAGIFAKTTDGGATWTQQTAFTAVVLMDVYFNHPNFGWICGDDGLVYYTSNGGSSWNNISVALVPATNDVNAVYYHGAFGNLVIGCDYSDIFTRNDAVSGDDTPVNLPFFLGQNYPNPFNPSTAIEFSLARDGFVSLNVYDVSGRLVARILNKEMKAGDYSIGFQATALSSGVYFYRLKSGGQEQVRKMILLR